MVKGIEVLTTKERIAKVTGLITNGENYLACRDARSTRENFIEPSDPPLNMGKQGAKRTSLPKPWK